MIPDYGDSAGGFLASLSGLWNGTGTRPPGPSLERSGLSVQQIADQAGSKTPPTDIARFQSQLDSGSLTENQVREIFGLPLLAARSAPTLMSWPSLTFRSTTPSLLTVGAGAQSVQEIADSVGSKTPPTDIARYQGQVDRGEVTLNSIRAIFGVPAVDDGTGAGGGVSPLMLVAAAAALYYIFAD